MAIVELIKIPTVQAFLMDGSVMTVFEAILEKFALPKTRAEELLDLTDAVLDGALDVKDIPSMLEQAFGVDEERATRMACDVVGFRLLPLEQYVPSVVADLAVWGADMTKYPKSRVGKTKMVPETFAAQLDEKLALNFSEVLIKRAGFLIGAYWNGEKTKESTVTFFSRGTTIGGLGLSPERAQELLAAVDASRDLVELIPGVSGERPPAVENSGIVAVKEIESTLDLAVEKSPSHELTSELPIINAPKRSRDHDEDEEGIADAARAARQAGMIGNADEAITAAVAKATTDAQALLETYHIPAATFSDVVRKALKGVRDLYQTRDVFARDLHVEGADLEMLTEIVETAHRGIHANPSAAMAVSSKQSKDREKTVPPAPSLLDQRFAALAKTVPKTQEEEVMPEARVSIARTVTEEKDQQRAQISSERLQAAAVASRPAPVKPMLTVGSVAPKAREGVLTDIQPVKRLIGPVEELATMTPVEFRRLSTVPADAVQKIEDMLFTLEHQSYEERLRGVAAWRKSPMNQLYIVMLTSALSRGVAVAEIAAQRRAAGEESLSPAEIRAVSELNDRVRFS